MIRFRSIAVAAVAMLLAFVAATGSAMAQAPAAPARNATTAPVRFTLPATTGPYAVGTTTLHLVDFTRNDPFVGGNREVMVTLTYPVRPGTRGQRAPWIEAALVPYLENHLKDSFAPGSVDWRAARRPALLDAPMMRAPSGNWPVVLFSPGLQYFRELYSATVDDLASRGYVVASMTHTYEAFFAAFPGGRVVEGLPLEETEASTQLWLDTRVADARFVLDALTEIHNGQNPDAEYRRLPAGLRGGFDLSRVGIYGHSYGGTTAAETLFYDRRFDAGLNFDGRLSTTYGPPTHLPYGPTKAARYGLDKPFLLMGAHFVSEEYQIDEMHTHLPNSDRSWVDFWRNQRGWKRDILLPRGVHFSFSDYPAIVPQLASVAPPDFIVRANGTMPPRESVAGVRAYVAAFFDLHLKRRPTPLFTLPNPAYPNFVRVP